MVDENDPRHTRRSVLRLTGTGAVLLALGSGSALAEESDLRQAAKEHVAEETGRPVSALTVVNESLSTFETLDERYYEAKVRGETLHGVTLDATGSAVDKDRVRERSRRAYRDQYGKLGRNLHRRAAAADADERIRVDVWANGIDRGAARQAAGAAKAGDHATGKRDLKAEVKRRIETATSNLARSVAATQGATVLEEGTAAPLVTARVTPDALDRIEQIPAVWTVLEKPDRGGDDLASAARTHESYGERNGDYEAFSYRIGVFEYSGYPKRDNINRADTYGSSSLREKHEHVVAMCAASTDDSEPGMASEADIYCAEDPGTELEKKVEWFDSKDVCAINFSFYYAATSTRTMASADLQWGQWMINKYRAIVKSAGNESSTNDLIVTTPAKGFNTISVGATDDKNTGSDQSDDDIAGFSCTKNPRSENDSPSSDYYPHDKPELSAVGSRIDAPGYSGTAGTSFSAPHVTGLAALVCKFGDDYSSYSDLEIYPEVIKPVMMAGALNDAGSFDEEGVGTVLASQAEEIMREGWFRSVYYDESNDKQTYTFDAESGEEVRVVLMWLSDVTASDFTDLKNARSDLDMDLNVVAPDGTSAGGSYAYDRGWEWTTFTADQTGTYTVEVTKFDWQSSDSNRFMGLAWHRS